MAPPRRQSLASRLLVTYAITVVLVLGVLGFFVERSAREVLLREVEHGLGEQARLLSASLPSDQGEMDALVSRLGEDLDARVTVVDRDGTVLADSHVGRRDGEPASHPSHAALDGGRNRSQSERIDWIPQTYVAVPTESGGRCACRCRRTSSAGRW